MALHPPAMGGKTAWGVGEAVSRPTDDPVEIEKMRRAQQEFNDREETRLRKLKAMEKDASGIVEERKARRDNFQPDVNPLSGETFKKKQDEIFKKMEEAKMQKRLAKKKQKEEAGGAKKKQKKKKKKESSSSSNDSASSSSSSGSSSSEGKKGKKGMGTKAEAPVAKQETESEMKQRLAFEAELKRKADEAKTREKEVKRKAKEQLAAWEMEKARRKVQEEAKKQEEVRQKAEAEARKKVEEAKKKADEAEAKKKADEAEAARKTAEAEAKKKLFESGSKRPKLGAGKNAGKKLAGGFNDGDHVVATQDITVRGNLVIRNGTSGTVLGPAETDPVGRLCVDFVSRCWGTGTLNVVPKEIRRG